MGAAPPCACTHLLSLGYAPPGAVGLGVGICCGRRAPRPCPNGCWGSWSGCLRWEQDSAGWPWQGWTLQAQGSRVMPRRVLPALGKVHVWGQLLCAPVGSRTFTPLNAPCLGECQGLIPPPSKASIIPLWKRASSFICKHLGLWLPALPSCPAFFCWPKGIFGLCFFSPGRNSHTVMEPLSALFR